MQISDLRLQLGNLLEAEEDWAGAAKALTGIPLESGHRLVLSIVRFRTLYTYTAVAQTHFG